MISSRLISRITEAEQLIEQEIAEGTVSHLRDIQADLQCSFDDLNVQSELRSKIMGLLEEHIVYEEQRHLASWDEDES